MNCIDFNTADVPASGVSGLGLNGDDPNYKPTYTQSYNPQVMHFSGGYDLPIGKGLSLLGNASGVANQIVSGWKTNFILTLQDGEPESVGCSETTNNDNGCNALLVPWQNMYAGPHNVNDWLNINAFTNPPVATTVSTTNFAPLGGSPGQFHTPGYHCLDFSLFKNFKTTERTHLEFRAEVFNLTTPQFGGPNTNIGSPTTFGQITSLRDGSADPREIQFALKLYF
jgi:hypothetical protein